MTGRLRGLGVEAEIPLDKLEYRTKKFEERAQRKTSTEHAWVFTVMHQLSEDRARDMAGQPLHLDTESIVMAGGPMCYRCEAPAYTPDPCPGYREYVRADESWRTK